MNYSTSQKVMCDKCCGDLSLEDAYECIAKDGDNYEVFHFCDLCWEEGDEVYYDEVLEP